MANATTVNITIPSSDSFIPWSQKGQPNGVATLDENGKLTESQKPTYSAADVGADPTGTAAQAVSTHNTSPDAHTSLFAAKQNKLTGAQGQVVGFDSQGNAQAQDPPGGGSGKRVCRFVVGTSTAGWTAEDCDYLCDGTADDVEINAAIQALPSTGGEVVILDGTYNITATIAMNKDNVTLSGNGAATVLKCMSNFSTGVVTVTADYCTVRNLQILGNISSYPSSNGIYLNNTTNSNVIGNICSNNDVGGVYGYNFTNSTVIGNTCYNNNSGIYMYTSTNNTVTGNGCNNNERSIYISKSSNNTIIGNSCIKGDGTPSDYEPYQYSIQISSGSQNNLIVGNNIMGKNYVDNGTNNTWANNKYQ